MNLEIFDIEGITAFNQDTEENMPLKVKEFKAKIREADAILIATPEYNYSVPGIQYKIVALDYDIAILFTPVVLKELILLTWVKALCMLRSHKHYPLV